MREASGIWLWATGTEGVEPWLVHLPSGATISISGYQHPGPAIALERDGSTTYLYWAEDIEDARSYLAELGKLLEAVDIGKIRTQKADMAIAIEIAQKHFPDAKEITAEIYTDPEMGDSYTFIRIQMDSYDENFCGRLLAARKEASQAVEDWVCIGSDFC